MSSVQLDDLYCSCDGKNGIGDLNIKMKQYTCGRCGRIDNGEPKMKVVKVNAKDCFDDDNDGLIFGLEEVREDTIGYVEWFKTKQERNNTIDLNNFEVVE